MGRVILILFVCFFVGCEKESSTNYVAIITNSTTHNIEIRPYYGGISPQDKRINLGNGENFEIANGTDRGKGYMGFDFKFFGRPDSMVVIFDGNHRMSHYLNKPAVLSNRYYLYDSIRNLMNYKSYAYKVTDESKHEMDVTYTYTFINQDYLDSQ